MTATATRLTRGAIVWSRKLNWGLVSGSMIRDRYGVSGGQLGRPAILTVRRAATEYACVGCGSAITRGTLHGSNIGVHYCPACITTTEPEAQFRAGGR